jgi:hypothetical protein
MTSPRGCNPRNAQPKRKTGNSTTTTLGIIRSVYHSSYSRTFTCTPEGGTHSVVYHRLEAVIMNVSDSTLRFLCGSNNRQANHAQSPAVTGSYY